MANKVYFCDSEDKPHDLHLGPLEVSFYGTITKCLSTKEDVVAEGFQDGKLCLECHFPAGNHPRAATVAAATAASATAAPPTAAPIIKPLEVRLQAVKIHSLKERDLEMLKDKIENLERNIEEPWSKAKKDHLRALKGALAGAMALLKNLR